MTRKAVTAQWFEKHRVRLKLLRMSPFVWFGGFLLFSFIVLYPITGSQQQATIDQFNQLPQLPNARRTPYEVGHKPDEVYVHAGYSTDKDYSDHPESLDAAFLGRGWQVSSDRQITAPGRDYCKGDYSASVTYYGAQYTVWLTYGNATECKSVRGGARLVLTLVQLLFPLAGALSWVIYALIIGRAAWTMNEEELEWAMGEIVDGPSGIGGTQVESVVIFLLSMAVFALSIYAIVTLNW